MSEPRNCQSHEFPWEGRGASLDITGARFSIYPMDNSFASIILDSILMVNTDKVYSESDALSTVYRGRLKHVFDCMGAVFLNSWSPGLHLALEGQVSKGCPGDSDADSYFTEDDVPLNRPNLTVENFSVIAKLALYPLGCPGYLDIIGEVIRMADREKLNPKIIHYATRIEGGIFEVLDFLEHVSAFAQDKSSHYVLHFTISAGSPTREQPYS
ncbi:MAG: Ykof family thiamine-binding protein [Deltaproteobacteria bacterium]|jgi:uncharacterized protein YqgV (UPF0045/DUF77 family)|nr:Ykof family thiamine-binding protein [Deltaproteobacteria bacterium]